MFVLFPELYLTQNLPCEDERVAVFTFVCVFVYSICRAFNSSVQE